MEGVRVAVYVVPESVKLVSFPPPVTVTSASVKSLVDSLDLPSAAVIVIVGDLVSYVHPKVLDSTLTLLLPAGSEYAFAATLID
ncbi:unnamed protein product [Bathycoccus prasinos]